VLGLSEDWKLSAEPRTRLCRGRPRHGRGHPRLAVSTFFLFFGIVICVPQECVFLDMQQPGLFVDLSCHVSDVLALGPDATLRSLGHLVGVLHLLCGRIETFENSQFFEIIWAFASLTCDYTDNPAALSLVPFLPAYIASFLGLFVDQGCEFRPVRYPGPCNGLIGLFFDLYVVSDWEVIIFSSVGALNGLGVACEEGFGLLVTHFNVLK